MKKTIGFNQFVDAFDDYDRADNFSYYGLRALYEYLEEMEHDTGKELELDVTAICCAFCEYRDLEEIANSYDLPDPDDYDDEEDWEEAALDFLNDRTMVIEFNGGLIIGNY